MFRIHGATLAETFTGDLSTNVLIAGKTAWGGDAGDQLQFHHERSEVSHKLKDWMKE